MLQSVTFAVLSGSVLTMSIVVYRSLLSIERMRSEIRILRDLFDRDE